MTRLHLHTSSLTSEAAYIRQITITNILDMASNGSKDIHNHGIVVDRERNKVKCNHCGKIISSGFYRLKYHLGGVKGDVSACPNVPSDDKEVFRSELEEKKNKKLLDTDIRTPVQQRSQLKRKSDGDKTKGYGLDADVQIVRPEGQIADQIPSHEELKEWLSNDKIIEMITYVEGIKFSLESTGCSILLDSWTDSQDRNFINVLVNCPKGAIYLKSYDVSSLTGDIDAMQLLVEEVIQEVGSKNVVQIITNSTSTVMDGVGKQIRAKHSHIFWTISLSTCIELMLEKIRTMPEAREVFEKAENIASFINDHAAILKELSDSDFHISINSSRIRSITPYLALENILSKKDILEELFASDAWEASSLSISPDGKKVADIVRSSSFWSEATWAMKGSSPLVNELRMLTRNNKPQAGFIYEKIDQLKETIKENLNHKKFKYPYPPFWDAIDDIWNNHLHSHLHSGGYYFNPIFFYSKSFNCDPEVASGFNDCISRLGGDYSSRCSIRLHVAEYLWQKRDSSKSAMNRPPNSSPVTWWLTYEREYPELSKMAIRILSQTCDGASKFNLNRNLAEMLTNEQRPIEKQLLTYYAFVHYNMQLRNFDCPSSSSRLG